MGRLDVSVGRISLTATFGANERSTASLDIICRAAQDVWSTCFIKRWNDEVKGVRLNDIQVYRVSITRAPIITLVGAGASGLQKRHPPTFRLEDSFR